MKLNYTDSSSDAKVFLRCSLSSVRWNPNDTITHWATVIIISVGFVPTILLNVLLITAVKRKKQLQTNCNILLCSMAVADLLVGVVCQPLQVVSNGFLRSGASFSPYFCAANLTNLLVGFFACTSSINHLTAIAWERFVTIKRPLMCRVVVTTDVVKKLQKLVLLAWLQALLSISPSVVTFTLAINSKYLVTLGMVFKFSGVVCLMVIAYFYTRICLEIRKRRQSVNAFRLAKMKVDSDVVKTTTLLTAVLLLSYAPMFVAVFLNKRWPALSDSSYFLWAMTLTQMNSLMNPLLYFYKNQRFRNAILELIRVRKPSVVRPEAVPVDLALGQRKTKLQENSRESAKIRPVLRARSVSCGRIPTGAACVSQDITDPRPRSAPCYIETQNNAVKAF